MSPAGSQSTTAASSQASKALALLRAGQVAQAKQICRECLKQNPDDAWAMHILGVIAFQTGRQAEALALIQYSISQGPAIPDFHNSLGLVQAALGRKQLAEASFRQALELRPNSLEIECNLANSLREQYRLEEAQVVAKHVLASHPNNPRALDLLGTILEQQGKVPEALSRFDAAIALQPDYIEARMNRAMALLLLGDFEHGWPEYEWRLRQPTPIYQRKWPCPRWDGSDLRGKSILLHSEGGLGNVIQFARFASVVADRGGEAVLEAPAGLRRLLSTMSGISQFIAQGEPLPACDFHLPLMSMPALLQMTASTVPAKVPYLNAEGAISAHFANLIASKPRLAKSFRIGINWQGNPEYRQDAIRSIPLSFFAPLAQVEGVSLISLQRGPGQDQLASAGFPIEQLTEPHQPKDGSFINAAGLMMHLDLVITSDTSIAHLAGALGVPVWVPLSTTPCWRWMLEREDSPWYPTMRLFRQKQAGDWKEVFERMAGELKVEVKNSTSNPRKSIVPLAVSSASDLQVQEDAAPVRRAFGFFDRTVVLNLDQDQERMKKTAARLDRLGIPFERFLALTPPPGFESKNPKFKPAHYACGRSHRAILEQSLSRNDETVLIFEDDVLLRDDTPIWMDRILHQLSTIEWDIFYLGLHLAKAGKQLGPNLLEVQMGFHAHAYAVKREAVPRLIAWIDRVVERQNGAFDGFEDPSLAKVCALPILAIQEPNFSHSYGSIIDRRKQYFTSFSETHFMNNCPEYKQLAMQSRRPGSSPQNAAVICEAVGVHHGSGHYP